MQKKKESSRMALSLARVVPRGLAAGLVLAASTWQCFGEMLPPETPPPQNRGNSVSRWAYSQDAFPGENFRDLGFHENPEVRRRLRLAGISSQRIDFLQSLGFSYGRVRQVVEEAARAQGYGPASARRLGHQVAQEIERLKHSGPYPSSGRDRVVHQRRSWRSQQIDEKLQQAGLLQDTITQLERRGYIPAEIEATVRDSLLERGYGTASAEMRARNLTNQIREIRNGASELQIRSLLSEAGLAARQIARLERDGFDRWRVQVLVQDALEDHGFTPGKAERRARDIAGQIEDWRE